MKSTKYELRTMNITKPMLIVTLLYEPNKEQDISDIYDGVIKQLARPTERGGLAISRHQPNQPLWINREASIFVAPIPVNELKHLELTDIAIIQIGINIPDGATRQRAPSPVVGWCEAEERLAEAMRGLPSAIEGAFVGRTIVYAASIPRDADADMLAQALLEQLRLEEKHDHLPYRALAACSFSDGKLWLLKTGRSGEANIYMTLEPDSEENPFKTSILFGNQALLIYLDTIAHKAYYMAREYTIDKPGDKREQFREASTDLMQHTINILAQTPADSTNLAQSPRQALSITQTSRQPAHAHHTEQLNSLSKQAATLTTVSANLRQLHSRLKIHQFNYQLAQQQHSFGDIDSYHEQQLKSILFRLSEDLSDANATLDATNTALNYLRADYEREQAEISERTRQEAEIHAAQKEKADERTQEMLAIMTVALTVAQLVGTLAIGWQLLLVISSGFATYYLIHKFKNTDSLDEAD